MSSRFRFEYNPLAGVWHIYRYNLVAERWVYVHSECSKSLCYQWCERNSY